MKTVQTVADLRRAVRAIRSQGRRIALVPTLGALHEGHMSLVRAGRQHADAVAATIFVNPTQFGPNEDLDAYPRQMAQDCAMLEDADVDLLFAPALEEMYPDGFATSVRVAGLTEVLCGADRPHHFGGVATVVTKLLLQALPDVAMFGEKDFQQLLVVERLVPRPRHLRQDPGLPDLARARRPRAVLAQQVSFARGAGDRAGAAPGPAGGRRAVPQRRADRPAHRTRQPEPARGRLCGGRLSRRCETRRTGAAVPSATAARRGCSVPPASARCA